MDQPAGEGSSQELAAGPGDLVFRDDSGQLPGFLLVVFDRVRCPADRSIQSSNDGRNQQCGPEVADFYGLIMLALEGNPAYSALVREAEYLESGGLECPEERAMQQRARALNILREYRGFSQRRLAEISGVNKTTISAYERGVQEIGSQKLDQILAALELPLRAWEATLRHLEWLDWLARRRKKAQETARQEDGLELAVDAEEAGGLDLRREIESVAEAVGREREQTVTRILDLLLGLRR